MAQVAPLEQKLDALIAAYSTRADTGAVDFALTSPSRGWSWDSGAQMPPTQYFIASTTKLYVSALVMMLRNEGRVDIDAPAADYLPAGTMDALHILEGVDSSARITVRQLLAHMSGIADYFEQKRPDGGTQIGDALTSDFGWTFDDVLRVTRSMRPRFAPGAPGKAFYSDTNYQLLGAIIEAATGTSFETAVHTRIIEPLGLTDTYPFSAATMARYDEVATMLWGKTPVRIPKAMASVRADGGVVSTSKDGLRFLEAFMSGRLFPNEYLTEMTASWNAIFPPLEYGVGVMRFALPWYYSPLRPIPEMIGHSGASGAVLYRVPSLDLYVAGTVNQIKKRSLSYNLMTRMVMVVEDAWRAGKPARA